jgi:hypothetical protein
MALSFRRDANRPERSPHRPAREVIPREDSLRHEQPQLSALVAAGFLLLGLGDTAPERPRPRWTATCVRDVLGHSAPVGCPTIREAQRLRGSSSFPAAAGPLRSATERRPSMNRTKSGCLRAVAHRGGLRSSSITHRAAHLRAIRRLEDAQRAARARAGQCHEVRYQFRSHRRGWRLVRRSPGEHAGHHGRAGDAAIPTP